MEQRRLSDEVLLHIASYLDPPTLISLAICNSHFCRLAYDPQLWKSHFWHTFVQPGIAPVSGKAASQPPLPTLAGLRSLLLHQKLASDKVVRGDGKRIARLPHRFYRQNLDTTPALQLATLFNVFDTEADSVALDWRQVYRVSINWQTGNFVSSHLSTPPSRGLLGRNDTDGPLIARASANYVFISRATKGRVLSPPVVEVYADLATHDSQTLDLDDLADLSFIGQLRSLQLDRIYAQGGHTDRQIRVTDIAIDAGFEANTVSNKLKMPGSPGNIRETMRVLVSYSGGYFALFRVLASSGADTNKSISAVEEYFHTPAAPDGHRDVAISALHSSALVLCSHNLEIDLYQIAEPQTHQSELCVNLVQRLSSYRTYWPASVHLKPILYHDVQKSSNRSAQACQERDEKAFRLTIAYATPAYPNAWTIGVQEVVMRLPIQDVTGQAIITSRHANARHAVASTPIDSRGVSSSVSLPWSQPAVDQASERNRITSLSYDDPFIVLGFTNNVLEVYELYGATTHVRLDCQSTDQHRARSATATPESSAGSLRLIHRRILYGHTGGVQSVALQDGRCVSGGADGNVMVWNLGERISAADSVASVVRQHKQSVRTSLTPKKYSFGECSDATSSIDMDKVEDTLDMTHLMTLQTPTRSSLGDSAQQHESDVPGLPPTSLQAALERSKRQDTSRGIIRWVSTTFDKIVSIVTYPSQGSNPQDAIPSRERVQIWKFG